MKEHVVFPEEWSSESLGPIHARTPREDAALEHLCISPDTSNENLATMFEISLEEAKNVRDYFEAWRNDG